MDNLYENIIPWNGANDTGKDVRLKLERNFGKVGKNFEELNSNLSNKLDIAYFKRVFGVLDASGNELPGNDMTTIVDSLKLKVGTWTEEYFSIKGKNPGTGGSVSLALSQLADVSLSSPSNGESLVYNSSLAKWVNGAAGLSKVTVKLGNVSYDSVDGTVYLPAYPTSLPASDVYPWAKQSSKPSYIWDEIGNKPSTFTPSAHTHDYILGLISSTNANTYIGDNSLISWSAWSSSSQNTPTGSYTNGITATSSDSNYGFQIAKSAFESGLYYRNFQAGWTGWAKIVDNLNADSLIGYQYIHKVGDTMTGRLTINYNDTYPLRLIGATNYSVIQFQDVNHLNAADIGWLNDYRGNLVYMANLQSQGVISVNNNNPYFSNDLSYFSKYTIWHSGNDGSDSGLDADLLDGYQSTDFTKNFFIGSGSINDFDSGINNSFAARVEDNVTDVPESTVYNWNLWQQGNKERGSQFLIHAYGAGTGAWLRSSLGDSNTWGSWRKLAFEDSNVWSATKLQTGRYVYGQYFDGQQNVSETFRSLLSASANGLAVHRILNYDSAPYGLLTRIYNNGGVSLQSQRETTSTEYFDLYLNDFGGNVGIGTNNPTDKLHVNGTGRFAGPLISDSRISTGYDSGIANSISCSNWFRTNGATGLFFSTYGGGLYMDETTYVKIYGGKSLYVPNEIYAVVGVWTDGYFSSKGQNTTSDGRLKKVISRVNLSIEAIAKAPDIVFSWKDGSGTDVGSIAQYWRKVLPFSVKELNNYLTLNYGGAAMVGLISVAKRVVNHEDRIKALEKENAQLKKEISNLERRLYA